MALEVGALYASISLDEAPFLQALGRCGEAFAALRDIIASGAGQPDLAGALREAASAAAETAVPPGALRAMEAFGAQLGVAAAEGLRDALAASGPTAAEILTSGLRRGIAEGGTALRAAAHSAGEHTADALRRSLDAAEGRTIGQGFMSTAADGVLERTPDLRSAAEIAARDAKASFAGIFSPAAGNAIGASLMDGVISGVNSRSGALSASLSLDEGPFLRALWRCREAFAELKGLIATGIGPPDLAGALRQATAEAAETAVPPGALRAMEAFGAQLGGAAAESLRSVFAAGGPPAAESLMAGLAAGLAAGAPALQAAALAAGEQAADALRRSLDAAEGRDIGLGFIAAAADGTASRAPALRSAAEAAAKGGKGSFAGVFSPAAGSAIGASLMDGVISGVNSRSGALYAAMRAIAAAALAAAKRELGISSPSRAMRDEVGAMIPAGAGLGIRDNMAALTGPVAEMAAVVRDAVSLRQPPGAREPAGAGASERPSSPARAEGAAGPGMDAHSARQIGTAIADRLIERDALRADVLIDGTVAGGVLAAPVGRKIRSDADRTLRGRAARMVLT